MSKIIPLHVSKGWQLDAEYSWISPRSRDIHSPKLNGQGGRERRKRNDQKRGEACGTFRWSSRAGGTKGLTLSNMQSAVFASAAMHLVSLVLAVLFTTISFAQGYKLTKSYKGNGVLMSYINIYLSFYSRQRVDFINDFDFWDGKAKQDPTGTPDHPSGAIYLPRTQARKQGLAKVNDKGRFGMKCYLHSALSITTHIHN